MIQKIASGDFNFGAPILDAVVTEQPISFGGSTNPTTDPNTNNTTTNDTTQQPEIIYNVTDPTGETE